VIDEPLWQVELHGTVAVASFTRPPRNLMSFVAMGELETALTMVAQEDAIHVVVLTGGVPGYFVAHADLDDLTRIGLGQPVDGDPGSWGRTLDLIESMPQPVVAAVNGQAWGGGCELALACTMRLAAASAHFAQPEVNVGIIPGAGGTQRMPRLIGSARAADLILSGRTVGADEALAMGLVNAVLPDDGFIGAVLEWVTPMASRPRHAVSAAKRAIVEGLRLPFAEGLRLEGQLFIECQTGAEALALQTDALTRYRTAGADERVEL
jgi:enoyl-CoA hydratase/carnithine racemase